MNREALTALLEKASVHAAALSRLMLLATQRLGGSLERLLLALRYVDLLLSLGASEGV